MLKAKNFEYDVSQDGNEALKNGSRISLKLGDIQLGNFPKDYAITDNKGEIATTVTIETGNGTTDGGGVRKFSIQLISSAREFWLLRIDPTETIPWVFDNVAVSKFVRVSITMSELDDLEGIKKTVKGSLSIASTVTSLFDAIPLLGSITGFISTVSGAALDAFIPDKHKATFFKTSAYYDLSESGGDLKFGKMTVKSIHKLSPDSPGTRGSTVSLEFLKE